MWNRNRRLSCVSIMGTAALVSLICWDATASAQTSDQSAGQTEAPQAVQPAAPSGSDVRLPQLVVHGAKRPKAQPRPVVRRVTPPPTIVPPVSPAEVIAERNNSFDQA